MPIEIKELNMKVNVTSTTEEDNSATTKEEETASEQKLAIIEEILKIDPGLLILVVSALKDKATAIAAMKKGAHGFLCKPFTEAELTSALSKLIKGAAA